MLVGTANILNIGDYIQAVAAEQFFDHIDTYVERERLDEYKGEPIKMIMNGWYMHEPKHWPPAQNINPLFVAFHVNSLAKDSLLAPGSINYLKKYEPIGCRDLGTVDLLKSKGIDAYFSACMTLTLGYKYKTDKNSGKCYFVDPYYILHSNDYATIIQNLIELPFCFSSVKKYRRKWAKVPLSKIYWPSFHFIVNIKNFSIKSFYLNPNIFFTKIQSSTHSFQPMKTNLIMPKP